MIACTCKDVISKAANAGATLGDAKRRKRFSVACLLPYFDVRALLS